MVGLDVTLDKTLSAERMEEINPRLAAKARKILDINKSERHIRGGMATKEKYHHLHETV